MRISRAWRRLVRALTVARSLSRSVIEGRPGILPGNLDCTIAGNEYGIYRIPRSSRPRPASRAVRWQQVFEPETVNLLRAAPAADIVSALTAALATIRRCGPLIVAETMPDPAWLAAELAPMGYRVGGSVHLNTVLRCDHDHGKAAVAIAGQTPACGHR